MTFHWHQLDGGLSYMSVHLGSGSTFTVLTTPISGASYDEHKALLQQKIKQQTKH
ncbi:MAG: hypothetical protein RIE86_09315 [Imperialibacter sp.]|uniref:hypothetical protein n=1 Tax=Imperialibacter sp. TaxID=2038411 RepID=UPI0032ECF34D